MRKAAAAGLVGGAVSGALDLCYAFSAYALIGVSPSKILQSIASGVLGEAAYSGRAATTALGLALHFFMTTLMAMVFVLSARRLPILIERPFVAGALYGLFLFAVMNLAVVPLSNAYPGKPPTGWLLAGALFAHIVLVGTTIALVARRFAQN